MPRLLALLLFVAAALGGASLAPGARGGAHPLAPDSSWPPAREDIVNVYRDAFRDFKGEEIANEKVAPLPSSFVSGHFVLQAYLAPPDQWLTVVDASMWGGASEFFWAETTKQGEIVAIKGNAMSAVGPAGGALAGVSTPRQAQQYLPFTPIAGCAAIGWTIAPGHQLALISDKKDAQVYAVSVLGYLARR